MDFQVIEQVVNGARRKLLVQDYIPVYYPTYTSQWSTRAEHSKRPRSTLSIWLCLRSFWLFPPLI